MAAGLHLHGLPRQTRVVAGIAGAEHSAGELTHAEPPVATVVVVAPLVERLLAEPCRKMPIRGESAALEDTLPLRA
jgi:hypothetical protein